MESFAVRCALDAGYAAPVITVLMVPVTLTRHVLELLPAISLLPMSLLVMVPRAHSITGEPKMTLSRGVPMFPVPLHLMVVCEEGNRQFTFPWLALTTVGDLVP